MTAGPWKAFWQTSKRLDRSKLNSPWMAFRNSAGVALPLGVGIATGDPLGAIAVATGAINVCLSDGLDPYPQRARRMLAWSVLGAFAVFTGSVTGKYHGAAILLAAAWAFVAGMLVSISTRAADLGLNTLVVLIIFAARGALSPRGALIAAGLVLGGGLLQAFLSLLFWPVHRYQPERRAIGKAYLDLSAEIDPHNDVAAHTPLNPPSAEVQDVLSALGRDHSVDGERFRLLLDQTDRLRLSVFALSRLRSEAEHEQHRGRGAQLTSESVGEILEVTSKLVGSVGDCLSNGMPAPNQQELLGKFHGMVQAAQARKKEEGSALAAEIASAVDVLAGQVRLVVQLAAHSTEQGLEEFARHEFAPPWKLQLTGWIATLRANLDLSSAPCRHAIRLALCVALADAIGRSISWERSYWLPMTAAIVLRPDFTTTLSRGVLRLLGTYAGLILATVLYLVLPRSAMTQALLVGMFTFFMRWVGAANYGIFSAFVGAMVVFLIAETGESPSQVVLERFLNTTAGGVLALTIYAVWPTWERKTVSEAIAEMLDACRDYFRAVAQRFTRDDAGAEAALDKTRRAWRRSRSSAEASLDRVASEPGITPARLECLTSMLASSHALVYSVMSLEAGIIQLPPKDTAPAFQTFANDVELTLYLLAAALRGWRGSTEELPKLRDDHRHLVEARPDRAPSDEFLLLETDRLTVSLNTLREQVFQYVSLAGLDRPNNALTRNRHSL